MRKHFGTLTLKLNECASLTGGKEGAAKTLGIARSWGGEFLVWLREQKRWGIDENPLGNMEPNGEFSGHHFSHPMLAPRHEEKVSGSFDFLADTCSIWLSQFPLHSTPENLDDMAHGQLAFGKLYYPHFHPRLGFIDELGSSDALARMVKKTELKNVFWANFFGPAYVEKYGRKFLLGAPGWKKEELDDGGVLYVVTENYYDWWTKPPKEVQDYFRTQVPGVKLYRAKSSYD